MVNETPRPRKTLSLKSGMVPTALEGLHPPAPPPRAVWKCKPCGAVVDLDAVEQDGTVRCPACGARLGILEEFLKVGDDPPPKVRARRAVLPPPPPQAKPAAAPDIKARPKINRPG